MKIFNNYNIKNESTFRIGATVKEVIFPNTIEELISVAANADYILGNCSNVLFSSENINKKIIITKKLDKFSVNEDTIKVECGTKGPLIAKEAAKRGLTGFEFLIGFPGSFGGMVCMNASAHNQSIADTFVRCRIFNLRTQNIQELNKTQMEFSYRNSLISDGSCILLDAEFKLKQDDEVKINEIMKRNIEFRQSRQPSLQFGNAGSIFKNPPNDSAGRLLDLCDFKGVEEGGAKVFDKHANFIINYNNATSKDVLTLMNKMYSKVKEKYTIKLTPEIKYIGDENTKEYELWKTMKENI
ncbi:UDP-N-acetylmuramate dehydrogenase [bacterium]|nr:UDP-N-acetylmuramate dehydrogenase [bacterium]